VISLPSIPFPNIIDGMAKAFNFVNLDFSQVIPLGCLTTWNLYRNFLLMFWLPILVALACALSAGIQIAQIKDNFAGPKEAVKNLHIKYFLLFAFVAYPCLSLSMLSMFDCTEVTGTYYLSLDLSLVCYDDEWMKYGIMGAVGVLLYPIGIPVSCGLALYTNRFKLESPTVIARFGFLYQGFATHYYVGELIEMTRKLGMAMIALFCAPGSTVQVGVGLLAALMFLAVHMKSQPYDTGSENQMQTLSMWGVAITLLMGLLLLADADEAKSSDSSAGFFSALLMGFHVILTSLIAFTAIFEIGLGNAEVFIEAWESFNEHVVEPFTDMLSEWMDNHVEDSNEVEFELQDAAETLLVAGAGFMAAQQAELAGVPDHVIRFSETVFEHYTNESQNLDDSAEVLINRRNFLEITTRWNRVAIWKMAHAEAEFTIASGGADGISKHQFTIWINTHFGHFSETVCQRAEEELTVTNVRSSSTLTLFRQLWILHLFEVAKAQKDLLDRHSFKMLVQCYSPEIGDDVVNRSFDRLIGDDDQSNDSSDGINAALFVQWTAAIFEDYLDEQFKAGFDELLCDLKEKQDADNGSAEEEEEEATSEDESDEDDENWRTTPGIPVGDIFDSLELEQVCGALLTSSPHTIWRSLKARSMVVSMVAQARDMYITLFSRFEHHRRELTRESGVDIDETVWPPASAISAKVARQMVPTAWELCNAADFNDKLRKHLTKDFIGKVNTSKYANGVLRNHMQALVLDMTNVIVEHTAESGVEKLVGAVDASI